MDKLNNVIRTALGWRPKVEELQVIEPEAFQVYDVTRNSAELDWASLEVLRWAPVWMTGAERLLLYTLIYGLRPARYLEIGTLHGGSALIVTAALDARQAPGQLVCVDPKPQIAPEHWKQLEPRATLLQGFSPAILPQARKTMGGPFDFVLIDGDHTHEGVLRDASGVLPLAAEGAYLLFHDSFFPDVSQAIRDFVARHPDEVTDCGPLTRDVTVEQDPQSGSIRWGGLRLLQVRRSMRKP